VKAERWPRSVICGLLALAQLLAFAHIAVVGHRLCAEHGEAIHAGSRGGAEPVRTLDVALAAPIASLGHEHEHCLCMVHGRERFLLPAPAGNRSSSLAVIRLRRVTPPFAAASVIALLSLAPKGSPPV
jgi:hypothetical protein